MSRPLGEIIDRANASFTGSPHEELGTMLCSMLQKMTAGCISSSPVVQQRLLHEVQDAAAEFEFEFEFDPATTVSDIKGLSSAASGRALTSLAELADAVTLHSARLEMVEAVLTGLLQHPTQNDTAEPKVPNHG